MSYHELFRFSSRRSRPIATAIQAFSIALLLTVFVVASARAQSTIISTYDNGLPIGVFAFDGDTNTVAVTTTVAAIDSPLAVPNQKSEQNGLLAVTYSIADFGGVTHGFEAARNWSSKAGLSFWFRGTGSGLRYQLEVFDNRSDPALDTAERFEYRFTDRVDAWQNFTIPFSAFQRATDYQPEGAPNDGLNLTSVWGYSFVLPQGSDAVFIDSMALTDDIVLADYENGEPTGNFIYNGPASTIEADIVSINRNSPLAMGDQIGSNDVLKLEIDVQDYGGIGRTFEPTAEDWRPYQGMGFWFYGSNSGERIQVELYDNRIAGSTESERYEYRFNDDFRGWRAFRVPFSSFVRSTDFQPEGVPDDGLTLAEVWGYDIVVPPTAATLFFDNFALLANVPDEVDNNSGIVIEFNADFPDGYYDFEGPNSTLEITTTVASVGSALEVPGQNIDIPVLSVDYNVSDYAGFAIAPNSNPKDWRGHTGVGFWFYGSSSGGTFQVEIFDNRTDMSTDTSERFEYRFVDDFSGWRRINIAFDDFFRSTDFQPVGAPDDGLNLNEVWGYGFILPPAIGRVYISELSIIDEAAVETFNRETLPSGYYQFSDEASATTGALLAIASDDPNARPFQEPSETVLAIDFNVESYGGVAVQYPGGPQDWSRYDGISFWLRGNNQGDTIPFKLFDNRSDPAVDDAERYEYRFKDHGPTWRLVRLRFADFVRVENSQPPTAPNDGLNLTESWGFELGMPKSTGTILFDQVSVFNGNGELGFEVKSSILLPFVSR